jgi:AraC-like DNA-binding protein
MTDPLAEVVCLLRPGVHLTKVVGAAGRWGVRRTDTGQPSYCVVLDGACRLTIAGAAPITLAPGDFVLIPAAYAFSMSSLRPPPARDFDKPPAHIAPGEVRHGTRAGPPDVRFLIGHCVFDSPDAGLLVSLLPQVVHVRGAPRLATVVELLNDESRAGRPARDVVLARLLEVLLIEALRGADGTEASPGLVRGLADSRLAHALRALHAAPERAWTVTDLAREAALSRSAFFERFSRTVGMAPMAYLLTWRMALAQDLLRRGAGTVAEVAERVGYGSASTFTVAFARHAGQPPGRYARARRSSPLARELARAAVQAAPHVEHRDLHDEVGQRGGALAERGAPDGLDVVKG